MLLEFDGFFAKVELFLFAGRLQMIRCIKVFLTRTSLSYSVCEIQLSFETLFLVMDGSGNESGTGSGSKSGSGVGENGSGSGSG